MLLAVPATRAGHAILSFSMSVANSSNIEGLGIFYLGREYDLGQKKQLPQPLLYDAKDLVTHAVCVGMTGSGKTGLCLSLIEEAAIDGIRP